MCDYCIGEGCACGTTDDKSQSQCECEIIGTKNCRRCGCEAQPWWFEIKIPGSQGISDMLWELYRDDRFFPATKNKIVQRMADSQEDSGWLNQNLPERMYQNADDIMSALIKTMPPIAWEPQPTEILWKYPGHAVPEGQEIIVAENQQAMMMSKSGIAYDTLKTGKYTISHENCPLLAAKSRKSLTGAQFVLNGSPVFFSPAMEFEVGLSVMGQTRALRRVMARGVARVRISSPKQFLETIGAKGQDSSQGTISALQRYCDEITKKEMLAHEMDELTGNPSLLEKALNDGLKNAGLEPLKVAFSSVGELGPGMFMPSATQRGDPKNYEQMKQMAESLRAAQMAQMQAIQQQMMKQQAQQNPPSSQPATYGTQTVVCSSCNTSNPQTSKFCGNCGKPLQPQKKICPKCGQQSDPSIKFCGSCGTKLD